MGRTFRAGACALAWVIAVGQAEAAPKCAKDNEVTAIQAASIQQQLMVAALTCHAVANFNAFQTGYAKELRRADADLMRMFKRFYGSRKGTREYHAFKTRLANDSSMRSIHDNPAYCAAADQVFAAALSGTKTTLANFVSGVQVQETSPFNSCNIRVAVGLSGARPVPDIIPRPKPAEFGGVASTGTSPIWKKPEGTTVVAYPNN
jgi:hypothetical protein